jgi:hypothetical protein
MPERNATEQGEEKSKTVNSDSFWEEAGRWRWKTKAPWKCE